MGKQIDSADRQARLGMIVPSSNTCLEPQTYRILGERSDVTVHSTRIPVTRIGIDESSDKQFDVETMQTAAELLSTAKVDAIAWNGTSGSWLGAEHDHAVVESITEATQVPATTSTLAILEILNEFTLQNIGLVTPYTSDVNAAVADAYKDHDIHVVVSSQFNLADNESFARIDNASLVRMSREVLSTSPDALVFLCTNLYGAPVVEQLEDEFGIPVIDSVTATLWKALQLADAAPVDKSWGRLLAK